jgi:hypothetical protein
MMILKKSDLVNKEWSKTSGLPLIDPYSNLSTKERNALIEYHNQDGQLNLISFSRTANSTIGQNVPMAIMSKPKMK